MVRGAGGARQLQQELWPRKAAHMERLCGASELRRVLAEAGRHALPGYSESAKSQRCRLVGPGRFLRSHEDLRDAGEEGHQPHELRGCGAVEPRWLVTR